MTTSTSLWCSVVFQEPMVGEQKRSIGGWAVPPQKLVLAQQMEREGKSRNFVARTLRVSRAALWRHLGPKNKKEEQT